MTNNTVHHLIRYFGSRIDNAHLEYTTALNWHVAKNIHCAGAGELEIDIHPSG